MLKTDNSALAGKRALVTAAARGIGAAVALKLAEHGADVAVTFEKSSEYASAVVAEIRAMGRKAPFKQTPRLPNLRRLPSSKQSRSLAGSTFWSTTPESYSQAISRRSRCKRLTSSAGLATSYKSTDRACGFHCDGR